MTPKDESTKAFIESAAAEVSTKARAIDPVTEILSALASRDHGRSDLSVHAIRANNERLAVFTGSKLANHLRQMERFKLVEKVPRYKIGRDGTQRELPEVGWQLTGIGWSEHEYRQTMGETDGDD